MHFNINVLRTIMVGVFDFFFSLQLNPFKRSIIWQSHLTHWMHFYCISNIHLYADDRRAAIWCSENQKYKLIRWFLLFTSFWRCISCVILSVDIKLKHIQCKKLLDKVKKIVFIFLLPEFVLLSWHVYLFSSNNSYEEKFVEQQSGVAISMLHFEWTSIGKMNGIFMNHIWDKNHFISMSNR